MNHHHGESCDDSMGGASEFFEQNIAGLSDPEKYNLYGGLSEMADELSALHDQMNKLSEKSDDLSALHNQINKLSEKSDELRALSEQMNRLEAAVAKIERDMRELRKSFGAVRAAPKPPKLRIKDTRRQPAGDVQSSAPRVIPKEEPPTKP
jgi:Uncharacterized archaeal coiled-coil protein